MIPTGAPVGDAAATVGVVGAIVVVDGAEDGDAMGIAVGLADGGTDGAAVGCIVTGAWVGACVSTHAACAPTTQLGHLSRQKSELTSPGSALNFAHDGVPSCSVVVQFSHPAQTVLFWQMAHLLEQAVTK
jgi:hypothetical protein